MVLAVGLEIIIPGCIYIVTQGTIGAVIIMLKRIASKKYKDIIKSLESLSQKNSEMMSLLSNDNDTENNPPISEERQARETNVPYGEEELTHRDVNLPNGNIIRIRNKIKS
jgi:hypothetical protein